MSVYHPDVVSPPGEILQEVLQERALSFDTFAYQLGIEVTDLYQLFTGAIHLTPELALRLERLLGISARFWSSRESQYQAWREGRIA